MAMTKQLAAKLRTEINEALEAVGGAYGVQITVGNMTIMPDNINAKLEIAALNSDGDAITVEASAFKRYASQHGLSAADLFKEFTLKNVRYRIVGLRTRSRRSPIVCEEIGGTNAGRRWVFPAMSVKRMIDTAFGRDPLIK